MKHHMTDMTQSARQAMSLRSRQLVRGGALLLLLLASCGRPDGQQTNSSMPTAAEATVAPTAAEQSAAPTAPKPTATPPEPTVASPPATFGVILPGIGGPGEAAAGTATSTVNAPLVVTPILTRTIPIVIGEQTLEAEIASTGEERQQGLMARQSMDENAGMLFVFPTDQQVSFWMRDTALPLSIAFIDSSGVIQGLADMQPFDDQTFHTSPVPVRYALEVNQGWFAEHGIAVGDRAVFILPDGIEIR
jgi:uncharacterized protein